MITISRRAWLRLSAAAPFAATTYAPFAFSKDPPALGQSVVEDAVWTDPARNRVVSVRIRWPSVGMQVPVGGRKVIIYSHGLGGTRMGGEVWGQAWASAGFVVVHLQHAGSDREAVRAPGYSVKTARLGEQLIDRLADVGFALDTIQARHAAGDSKWQGIDAKRFALAGHSFGSQTTLGMAGQRYPSGQSINEPRLISFIALSPKANERNPQGLAGITRPVLAITGTLDGDVIGDGTTPAQRAAVYTQLPNGNKALLVLQDADHMSFGGQSADDELPRRLRGEAIAREKRAQHQAVVAQLTTDWWRTTLLADASASDRLKQPTGVAIGDVWQLDKSN